MSCFHKFPYQRGTVRAGQVQTELSLRASPGMCKQREPGGHLYWSPVIDHTFPPESLPWLREIHKIGSCFLFLLQLMMRSQVVPEPKVQGNTYIKFLRYSSWKTLEEGLWKTEAFWIVALSFSLISKWPRTLLTSVSNMRCTFLAFKAPSGILWMYGLLYFMWKKMVAL